MLYFCIIFIYKLLGKALWMQMQFDCIMLVFCTLLFNISGLQFSID